MALTLLGTQILDSLSSLSVASLVIVTFLAALLVSLLILGLAHCCSLVLRSSRAFCWAMATVATVIPPDPKHEEFTFPNKDGTMFTAKV